jgi:predicted permease
VFRQLLTEALLLSVTGGALGLVIAYVALTSASTLLGGQLPRVEEVSIDGRVLLFTIAVSMLTGVLAGTLPGVRGSDLDLNDAVKDGERSDGSIGVATRRVLIVCEVALSLVLLMGAGVMVRSLLALRSVDAGFNPTNVLTMRMRLIEARYSTGPQRAAFVQAALQRIRALPGVVAAGTVDTLPFAAGGSTQILGLEGRGPRFDAPAVQVRQISPGYLRAMGIPVLRGRDVVDSDTDVLLISETTAKLYWGTEDPIGRRARLPALSRTLHHEVVGIVGDAKQRNLMEGATATPTVYFYTRDSSTKKTFVIRTSVPPAALVQPAIAAIHEVDREQPVADAETMTQVLDETLTAQRISARLLGIFAGIAVLLAAVGIYSVLSYIVRGRRREIGIRTALGARRADVLWLVTRDAMWPAIAGIAVGGVAALASAKVMATLVFGVTASDPVTLAGVAVTLAVVALLASVVPAWHAAHVDPVKVLRAE